MFLLVIYDPAHTALYWDITRGKINPRNVPNDHLCHVARLCSFRIHHYGHDLVWIGVSAEDEIISQLLLYM